MAGPDTIRKIDGFWAGYFGCDPADLNGTKTLVQPHKALKTFDGVLVFRHAEACLVSVPGVVPEIERAKLRAAAPAQAFDPDFLAKTFVVWKDRVSPPAWVGVCDKESFKPVATTARLLTPDDEAAMLRLAEGCGEVAWKQSKLASDRNTNFGLFEGNEIVAASGYLVMGGLLAYIGVVTHPAHRGKGHAKRVVSGSMAHAFGKGLIAMWRTPQEHGAAVKLAGQLGFTHYASTYDVQLTEDEF